ncbi:MAG: aspartate aminotransferase family protein [Armatimonadota bacterium]|nr:aspartate aminotransferase family protein [Armatimonadota bacterium]MDR7427140.1 aspartate aminotransferase family protein [Armatimonadota bacterium]MDR7473577.1 aspartate aminotransferase family protein [Armatimonadota bacterium]
MIPDPQQRRRIVRETFDKYARFINPGLVKLFRLGGEAVEWEAEGAVVRDIEGKEYLDFSGGPAVFILGHRHPRVVEAVIAQMRRMPASVRAMARPPEADLAALLAQVTPGDLQYSFFCHSGTEANEGAIKLARLATGRPGIIATEGAFHGKTLGALSASGREKYRAPFQPLVPGFRHVPFGDAAALEAAIDDQTAAFLVEPIQGEAGVIIPPPDYLPQVREICDRRGVLLMVDEVQTGMGRTGRMFACEHAGVTPDVLTMAKGLGGGVMPLGAFIARPALWEKMAADPFLHSSTMGGNQAACAAGVATIQTILEEGLIPRAVELGDLLLAALRRVQQRYPRLVRDVRGKGLLVGVELESADVALMVAAWSLGRGLIVYFSLNNPMVLRLAPPLVITPEQIATGVERLEGALADVAGLLAEAEAEVSSSAGTGG